MKKKPNPWVKYRQELRQLTPLQKNWLRLKVYDLNKMGLTPLPYCTLVLTALGIDKNKTQLDLF